MTLPNPFARRHPCYHADAAMALGIASLFACVLAPLAIIYGVWALKRIDASGGALSGRARAWLGVVLGLIVLASAVSCGSLLYLANLSR